MFVLRPSRQPLAHEGQETIKKSSSAKKLFMEEVIQECQRQDNEKQVVEKEKEQENQTPNPMQTAYVDDQMVARKGSECQSGLGTWIKCYAAAIFGELRIDGHERDGGKKMKRMSEADQVIGSSAMHSDAGELMTDGHERDDNKKGKKTRGRTMKVGIHALTEKDQKAIIMNANFQPIGPDEQTVIDFVEFLGTLSRTSSLCPLTVDKWTDMNKVYKDAKEKMWDYVKTRMEELQSQQNGKSGEDAESSCSVDLFLAIMGKEHNGYVRLHGRGVTPSSLGKASAGMGVLLLMFPMSCLNRNKVDVAHSDCLR
ncbi:hypothetical protein Dimus_020098 [Dionaea muscipula]